MSAAELPPTPNPDVSPPQVVVVVGWLVTATMVVGTGTRLGTKISLKRLLDVDDYLCIAATIIGIGQMVATFALARLSIYATDPVEPDWIVFQKAYYIAQLLFIPTVCFAKLSVLYALHKITPIKEHQWPIIAFAGLVGLILFAFEFSTAFQCSPPHWAVLSGKCFKQTPFWQTFGVLDIATDAFVVVFPIYIVSSLQMALNFKFIIAGVFVARIATIAASVCRVIYLSRSDGSLEKDAFSFWIYILNTEIEQGLSVITACIPFLKPFFESLETGMLAPNHGLTTLVGSADGSGDRSKKSKASSGSYRLRMNPDHGHGINVSRRVSTHSEELELIKDEQGWVLPMLNHQI